MRLAALMAVNVSMLVLWVVMPRGLEGRYQTFRRNILPPPSDL
jgi:hypothetical protein